MPLKLTTYYRGKDIPDLPGTNTFHSKELFQIYESTPGYTPLLIVATEEGRPVARLLAAIRKAKKQQNTTVQERLNSYVTNMEISILLR